MNEDNVSIDQMIGFLVTSHTKVDKLGEVAVVTVGTTREQARESCIRSGCALLTHGCFAWNGRVLMASVSRWGSKRMKLLNAVMRKEIDRLDDRSVRTKAVRIADIGNPAAWSRATWNTVKHGVRSRKLAMIGYIHGWQQPDAIKMRGDLMASCETLNEVDFAVSQGWRATVIMPWWHPREVQTFTTTGGNEVKMCPAQLTKNLIQCNECQWCDASGKSKRGKPYTFSVGFFDHSKKALAQKRAAMRRGEIK